MSAAVKTSTDSTENKSVSGVKRSFREFQNQNADNKQITIDVKLIYLQNERNLKYSNKSSSSAESVKEEKLSKKGFGFKD